MTTETAHKSQNRHDGKSDKKAHKKRRKISKHILQAQKDHVILERSRDTEDLPEGATVTTPPPVVKKVASQSSKKKNKKEPNTHTKDIKEAAGYLSNWKLHRQQWKFNKNTQSWLIRHMYEADKVSKSTFGILMEYLQGLQGQGAKQRIRDEATRRALRYKEYSERGGDNNQEDKRAKTIQFASDTKEPAEDESASNKQDPVDEESRWKALDDHDKRKEYKRARKVLKQMPVRVIERSTK